MAKPVDKLIPLLDEQNDSPFYNEPKIRTKREDSELNIYDSYDEYTDLEISSNIIEGSGLQSTPFTSLQSEFTTDKLYSNNTSNFTKIEDNKLLTTSTLNNNKINLNETLKNTKSFYFDYSHKNMLIFLAILIVCLIIISVIIYLKQKHKNNDNINNTINNNNNINNIIDNNDNYSNHGVYKEISLKRFI